MIRQTDARQSRIETRYDALNRPLERRIYTPTQALEATHHYVWDSAPSGIGRLAQASTGFNTLNFGYDLMGHTTTRRAVRGTLTHTVAWVYQPTTGQRSTLTYPSGRVIQYQYDAVGRLSDMTWDGQPIATALHYTPFGALASVQLANGLVHQRQYDLAGRVSSYTLAGDMIPIHYDLAGQIDRLTPTDTSRHQQFGYDAAGRLTSYVSPENNETYSYDANGNRLSRTINTQTTAYTYLANSNRLLSIAAQPLTHDSAGNRLTDFTRQYTYDSHGRLIQLLNGTQLARYEYNALGERVFKQVGTNSRHFVYDDDGHLLGEYGPTGLPLAEYAWLGDLPIAVRLYRQVNNLTVFDLYTIEADHLGTPRVLTDSTKGVRWRWQSAPFGETAPKAH